MKWTCQKLSEEKNQLEDVFYQPKTQNVEVDYFTMGQLTKWQCQGDSPLDKNKEWKLSIKEEKKEGLPFYTLESLTWIDESTFNLNLRFYKIQNDWPFLLKNKEEEVVLDGINPNIGSVLEYHELKQESAKPRSQEGSLQTAEQLQPYPTISGVALSYPLLLWLILALLLSALFYYTYKKWQNYYKLKKFRLELKENFIATSAVQNFYKDMRALYREKNYDENYINKFKKAYKDYLMYRFEVPVKEWSNKRIYRQLKREQKALSDAILRETYSYLEELSKLSVKDSVNDGLKNFIHDIQNNVEAIEKELK